MSASFRATAFADESIDELEPAPPRRRGRVSEAAGDEVESPPRPRWRRRLTIAAALAVAAALATTPTWVPPLLARLTFFHVRRVEIDGARYAPPAELLARLRVDTTWSVWSDLALLARRAESHPLVASASVERRLPGTLRVSIAERVPVAMTPTRDGLAVVDVDGRLLPIDPSRSGGVDVPVVTGGDTATLRMIAAIRAEAPALYRRMSDIRRRGGRDVRITLAAASDAAPGASRASVVVLANTDLTAARLDDLLPVERDLARRRTRAAEFDLRFRDQVIARLP